MSLEQTLRGIHFKNPVISASGKWAWHTDQLQQIVDGGAGGITTKSFSTLVRKGHTEPTTFHTDHYTLNAVGLPSDGFEAVRKDIGSFIENRPVPVIISIFGDTVERFAESAAAFSQLGSDGLELNISCPNVADDHGTPFSYAPKTAASVIKAVKKEVPGMPLFAKLSPNVPTIASIAEACADAGCAGFTLVNTFGPGMAIDLTTRRPKLSNKTGGVSGAALKPIAVRCIADVYRATEGKLPIIGVGGVTSGEDAIELMMAGASLVGVGTVVLNEGYESFARITKEIEQWMGENGVASIGDIVGVVHR